MCYKVKGWLGYDDALDTFGVHAIGGTTGAIMTGMLARNAAMPTSRRICKRLRHGQLAPTAGLGTAQGGRRHDCVERCGTIIIAYITKALVGLRPTEEVEISGLDENEHGEGVITVKIITV